MRKIWAVALKELRQVLRDPYTLIMLLGVPAFMLLTYGYALNFDIRHVAMAVEDNDHGVESRDLVAAFVNSTYFDLVAALPAGADLRGVTERREARAVLVIPEGFGADVAAGRTGRVQLILDGTDANTATTVLGYANAIVAERNVEIFREGAGARAEGAAIEYRPRVWYNPELRSTNFLVPGLMGFILMITAVLSTAMSVVREKELGTMEQLRVTSLRPAQLILGKTIPYLGLSLVAAAIIVVAANLLFGVQVAGSYLDLLVITLVYLVGALGWGLLVSSISDSQAMAFQIGALSSMLPAIFLSGFIFPIRSMPLVLQAITYAFPTRYYLVVIRGIFLKGAGMLTYWHQVLFLVLYTTVVFAIAWARLSRDEVNA
ncbi:MAG TPA: ABC transporter permease [Candidatus Saccharimonadales bacterium]|nr:ABC transporter permease [Candidatus Saccharimonadales bacterium]